MPTSKTHSSKAGKRILSVTIKRMVDDSPDTSHLGEYANSPTSEFSIDRAHSEDCASLFPMSKEGEQILERAIGHLEDARTVCEEHIHTSESDCEVCEQEYAEQKAIDTLTELQSEPDCDCNGGDMGRGEYRYFNPSFNYVDKQDKPTDGLTPADVRKYTREDYERMESLNRGEWCYIGIRAEAEITVLTYLLHEKPGHSGNKYYEGTTQIITSGGLWGIESDSDESYFAEIEAEELANLKGQLSAIGFSKRAISTAFKNVEREAR